MSKTIKQIVLLTIFKNSLNFSITTIILITARICRSLYQGEMNIYMEEEMATCIWISTCPHLLHLMIVSKWVKDLEGILMLISIKVSTLMVEEVGKLDMQFLQRAQGIIIIISLFLYKRGQFQNIIFPK